MSKQRKIWVNIGFSLGGLLTIISPFVPGFLCADSCSNTPPNLQLLVIGITILIVTAILRLPPATEAEKLAFKESAPERSGDLWPARNGKSKPASAMGNRSGKVGWAVSMGAFVLISTINAGVVLIIWPLFPLFLIGLIFFAIDRGVTKRNANKMAENPQESDDSTAE